MQTIYPFNLPRILNSPLDQSHYPNLEAIIKLLSEHMQKCVKNREYAEAQKAKDKIEEAQSCIKRRNASTIIDKMMENMKRLEAKHDEEKQRFFQEWDEKIEAKERKYREIEEKKRKIHEEELSKLREQAQLALPITYSPDDRLKNLRYEERELAKLGKFMEAQRKKAEIEAREAELEDKHRKIRDNNIRALLGELAGKREREARERERQRKAEVEKLVEERGRKFRELEDRHLREIKENKWIHNQEMRLKNTL